MKSEAGVTLIEMIIAITIIAILGIVAIPRLMEIPQKARIQAAKQQIHLFDLALAQYEGDNGTFPSSEQGLDALVKKPDTEPVPNNYNERGYMQKMPMDPWGRPYVYVSPGEHGNDYEIMSYGADGQEGGEGKNADIKSWE
ncbi:MAG: type II secretion system major pseudopilin GspG [Spirochaetes bacterium]|nr:type II secretion system major pseudopilin GspG [Spirochaetota bacterium]